MNRRQRPKDTTVLVTGISGFLGGHAAVAATGLSRSGKDAGDAFSAGNPLALSTFR